MTISSAASPTPARRSRLLHRNLREDPPVAVGGRGVWLVDAQGREVLDGSGGAAVSCLGHQHPRVLAALASQAQKLAYAHTSFFTTEIAEALADELVGHEPGGLASAYWCAAARKRPRPRSSSRGNIFSRSASRSARASSRGGRAIMATPWARSPPGPRWPARTIRASALRRVQPRLARLCLS